MREPVRSYKEDPKNTYTRRQKGILACQNECATRGKTSQYPQSINNPLHSIRLNSFTFLRTRISCITRRLLQF